MATKVSKKRLGDILIEQNLITDEQLRECVNLQRQQGGNLASILLEREYLSEEDLVVTLSEQIGIPHIRVAHYNIPEEVLLEVPESLARQYIMMPVSVTGGVLTLAMADPLKQLIQTWIDLGITPTAPSTRIDPDDTTHAPLRRKSA